MNHDMELTSQELSKLYSQIENKSNKEIKALINDESETFFSGLEGAALKGLIAGAGAGTSAGAIIDFGWFKRKSDRGAGKKQSANSLIEICKEYAKEFSTEIKAILKNNPKSTNYALNVIQLLAPAIAQQYSGIPALAIVGSITLLCRPGLEHFIK